MGIFWLLILIVGVAAVVAFIRTGGVYDRAENAPHRLTGLDILAERYARGEINREEYLQKRQDILGRGPSA